MQHFLKISPECVTESWKYSSKIHCQIDLLLVWSTHNSFHQLQHFFIAPFTLPSHRSFFHSFPFFFHMELMMVLCWFDNNIISLFIYDGNSTVLCVYHRSLFFAAHHWCHTCVWVLVISMTRYSTRLKNWICSLKCTWHAGFFYVRSWRWYLGNWVVTEHTAVSWRMKFNHGTFHALIHDFEKFTNDVDAYEIEPFQLNILSSHVNHFYFLFPFALSYPLLTDINFQMLFLVIE